eukprot:2586679-Pleurochrysis_carterae.AAC.1
MRGASPRPPGASCLRHLAVLPSTASLSLPTSSSRRRPRLRQLAAASSSAMQACTACVCKPLFYVLPAYRAGASKAPASSAPLRKASGVRSARCHS